MKLELLLIASILSHLANYTGMVDSQATTLGTENISSTNKITNTNIIPTTNTSIATSSAEGALNLVNCYNTEYTLKHLDAQATIDKMAIAIKKDGSISFKITTKPKLCGLFISKNHQLNNYNFKYGFFNNSDCSRKTDTICDTGNNCTETAIKCCKGNSLSPCNTYGITPNLNTSCLQSNKANCFQITFGLREPTQKNKAVITTTANYYLTVIQTAIGALFIYNME